MFTGLISEIGIINSATRRNGGMVLSIQAPHTAPQLRVGDSIAIDGACHTITECSADNFSIFSSPETIARTIIPSYQTGTRVHLELPRKAAEPLGGHFVQGHVDTTISVLEIQTIGTILSVIFALDPAGSDFVVEKGSIALNGVSLTISKIQENQFSVTLIPHTITATTLGALTPGSLVNVEYDILAKYARRGENFSETAKDAIKDAREPAPNPATYSGAGFRFAIMLPRFNENIGSQLLSAAVTTLQENGVHESDISIYRIPGAYELPVTARTIIRHHHFDALIALGVVIRGETSHYDQLCNTVAHELSSLSVQTGVPITYGLVTTETTEQAYARATPYPSSGSGMNRGHDAALAALEMANLLRSLTPRSRSKHIHSWKNVLATRSRRSDAARS